MPKLSPFQNSRTTYKSNLTCTFLSVGLKLLFTFQYEMPCSKNPNENRGLIAFELCKYVLQFKLSVVSTSDHLAWYRRLIKKIKKHRKEYFLTILIWGSIAFFQDPPQHRGEIYQLLPSRFKDLFIKIRTTNVVKLLLFL